VIGDLRRRRAALFVLFFLPGLTLSSWASRTPDVRDLLHASTAEMGLVLFGLSVGSMVGILGAGPLVSRWGARRMILSGTGCLAAAAAAIALGSLLVSPILVATGLALAGYGMGSSEVAANIEGAEVERGLGRSVLPALHGCFSVGTVTGGACGMLLTASRLPVPIHLTVVAVVDLVALIPAVRHVSADAGKRSRHQHGGAKARRGPALWTDVRIVLLGAVLLGLALAEGSANDWLPLLMVDGHGFSPTLGSAAYVLFVAAMACGRFAGGVVVDRIGRGNVLILSGALAAVGVGAVSFVDDQLVAVIGTLLWGLGAALGFPVALSAAADSEHHATARVSFVAIWGYVAFLAGPPVLGLIGQDAGLRAAVVPVLVLVVISACLAPFAVGGRLVGTRRPRAVLPGEADGATGSGSTG
jgi:MFS family permease